MNAELDWLRQHYIDDLTRLISYDGRNTRPRVRHPQKWANLQSVIQLNEGVTEPLDISDRNVWVWSDTHFWHKNIIEFSKRPFINIDEMNEALVGNYNDYVQPDDVCIWGGDVAFKGNAETNELLDRCNGYKILVAGNHDFKRKHVRALAFDEIHLLYLLNISDVGLLFTHYPMYNIPWPWFNVHGHLHSWPKPDTGHNLHYNMCVELHEYKPINITEIVRVAKIRIESDRDNQ